MRGRYTPAGDNFKDLGPGSPRCTKFSRVSQPSCDGRPDGSLPAFAWGNVPTPIRIITIRHSLFPSSHTCTANSVPCGSPTGPEGPVAIQAYHVPGMSHD
jgi:hypothetical protein